MLTLYPPVLLTGNTSEEPLGPANDESTITDDVDTKTAIVTEVIDDIQKVTATGQTYPDSSDVVEETEEEVKNPAYLPEEIGHVTAKATTDPDVKPTTTHTKQIVKPIKKPSNETTSTNTTFSDSSESNNNHVTEQTQQNTTHILHTLRRQRTENTNETSSNDPTNKLDNVTMNNLTSEFIRIPNSSLASSTSFQVDTSTSSTINRSTVQVRSDKTSLFVLDSTSPTSLPTTIGSESTTAYEDSREYTSPRREYT